MFERINTIPSLRIVISSPTPGGGATRYNRFATVLLTFLGFANLLLGFALWQAPGSEARGRDEAVRPLDTSYDLTLSVEQDAREMEGRYATLIGTPAATGTVGRA